MVSPLWLSALNSMGWRGLFDHTVVRLFVFNVPTTARSFRDGTRIYCPLRRTWSLINTPFPPGIEPRAIAWQSITLPLRHVSSTCSSYLADKDYVLYWRVLGLCDTFHFWGYISRRWQLIAKSGQRNNPAIYRHMANLPLCYPQMWSLTLEADLSNTERPSHQEVTGWGVGDKIYATYISRMKVTYIFLNCDLLVSNPLSYFWNTCIWIVNK